MKKTGIKCQVAEDRSRRSDVGGRRGMFALLLTAVLCSLTAGDVAAEVSNSTGGMPPQSSLEETRLKMDKWIETQQIISKESKDWQQGKSILSGRLELVNKEIATLTEKNKLAETSLTDTGKKRMELLAENDQLKATGAQLAETITKVEADIRRMYKQLPQPLQEKLQPLHQRVPSDPAKTTVSTAERFQTVLGILNELNKANNDISISYEVHNLANGKPAEVKVLYVGLAQAYYVSARGEAGIGRPAADGWKWEPSKTSAREILVAQEILQGKQTPAFVPLPVKIQ